MLVVVLGPKSLHSWSAATVVQFLRHALKSPYPQFQTLNSFFVHISGQFYTAMNLDQMNQPLNFLHARSEHQQCLHQETLSSISWLVCSSWPYFHPNDPSTSTIRTFQKMARISKFIFWFPNCWGDRFFGHRQLLNKSHMSGHLFQMRITKKSSYSKMKSQFHL